MGTSRDVLLNSIDEQGELIKVLKQGNKECIKQQEYLEKELKKYKKGYSILMEYWDSISDEEKSKTNKELKKIGL